MSTQTALLLSLEATSQHPLYPVELPAAQRVEQITNPPSVHWYGWCVTRCAQAAVDSVCLVFNNIINSVTEAVESTYVLNSIFRKLDRHILPMIEQLRQIPPDYFSRFSTAIKSLSGALHFMQIPVDIDYFIGKSFRKDTLLNICGKMFRTASDIGYGFLWLQELGINKLSNVFARISNCRVFNFVPALVKSIPVLRSMPRVQQAAASIGNLRIFSLTSKITLNSFAQRAFSLAYLFFTAQSFLNFIYAVKTKEAKRITGATLEILYHTSELALESLLFFRYSSTTGLGVLALASIAFALANLSYTSHKVSERKKRNLK